MGTSSSDDGGGGSGGRRSGRNKSKAVKTRVNTIIMAFKLKWCNIKLVPELVFKCLAFSNEDEAEGDINTPRLLSSKPYTIIFPSFSVLVDVYIYIRFEMVMVDEF